MLQTLSWTGQCVRLLDQTKLPTETVYLDITDEKQMWDAIKRLVVRGAPAIGVAAAFGVYLGVRSFDGNATEFIDRLRAVCGYLASSRPTAVNLFWAIARVRKVAEEMHDVAKGASPPCHVVRDMQEAILDECLRMLEEDNRCCRAIGGHGMKLLQADLKKGSAETVQLLTHCNAGGLATVQYGTALSPIYVGAEHGMKFHVFVDETRPLLQGSRITTFELQQNGIPATLICDNMAASVMKAGKVYAAIVGADRIAANGDVANKIGTLGVAILCRHFNIPFYVAAPTSTVDLSLTDGGQIPIEERDSCEITDGMGRKTAPQSVEVFNPAFDVTPAELVSAIITENGVARRPYEQSLAQLCAKSKG
jgi:methylthioribose-1-phosphate isomerase